MTRAVVRQVFCSNSHLSLDYLSLCKSCVVNNYELDARAMDIIFSAVFIDVKVVTLVVLYEPGFWSSNCSHCLLGKSVLWSGVIICNPQIHMRVILSLSNVHRCDFIIQLLVPTFAFLCVLCEEYHWHAAFLFCHWARWSLLALNYPWFSPTD